MPLPKKLPAGASKAKKQAVIGKTMSDLQHGPHHGDRTRAQEIAISEKQAGNSRGSSKKKDSGDSKLLERHSHHTAMAEKHRAHADLIEAKLRTQGKRIDRYGDYSTAPSASKHKPKIVKSSG
jgi:hypothetical protein